MRLAFGLILLGLVLLYYGLVFWTTRRADVPPPAVNSQAVAAWLGLGCVALGVARGVYVGFQAIRRR